MKKISYAKPEKLSVPYTLLIKEVVCSTGQLEINVLVHFPSSPFHKPEISKCLWHQCHFLLKNAYKVLRIGWRGKK